MTISMKAARVNAGFTQQQAADAIGKSKGAIASYEMNKTIPDYVTCEQLAKLYGMDIKEIQWAK